MTFRPDLPSSFPTQTDSVPIPDVHAAVVRDANQASVRAPKTGIPRAGRADTGDTSLPVEVEIVDWIRRVGIGVLVAALERITSHEPSDRRVVDALPSN